MLEIYEILPEPYKDAIYTTVQIHLSFSDKIKVLLGASLTVNIQNLLENPPGQYQGNAETVIGRVFAGWRRKQIAFVAENKVELSGVGEPALERPRNCGHHATNMVRSPDGWRCKICGTLRGRR